MDPKTWLWIPKVKSPESLTGSFLLPVTFIIKNESSSHVSALCVCTAVRDDLYFDVGCLLALALVHSGPPISFFSPTLYQCLFNYPANQPLTVSHMTPGSHFTCQINKVRGTVSLPRERRGAGMWIHDLLLYR